MDRIAFFDDGEVEWVIRGEVIGRLKGLPHPFAHGRRRVVFPGKVDHGDVGRVAFDPLVGDSGRLPEPQSGGLIALSCSAEAFGEYFYVDLSDESVVDEDVELRQFGKL
ncbi:hypothetical protein GCM10022402_16770 [Salinactinospora qingdaonensis]|uniref:Uncharacterized protein n=1 Tax=Salinactinospora qingdaonensis TaxID=702744 RepID=A0ABP7FJC2_9ACTN